MHFRYRSFSFYLCVFCDAEEPSGRARIRLCGLGGDAGKFRVSDWHYIRGFKIQGTTKRVVRMLNPSIEASKTVPIRSTTCNLGQYEIEIPTHLDTFSDAFIEYVLVLVIAIPPRLPSMSFGPMILMATTLFVKSTTISKCK